MFIYNLAYLACSKCFFQAQNVSKSTAVCSFPQTSLGEHTALPRASWMYGTRGKKGQKGEKDEEKGGRDWDDLL